LDDDGMKRLFMLNFVAVMILALTACFGDTVETTDLEPGAV
jgi:hypothetical protein